MNNQSSQSNTLMEQRLRKWGAAKAIEQASASLRPMQVTSPPCFWHKRSTWAMAASVILLITGSLVIQQLNSSDDDHDMANQETSLPQAPSSRTIESPIFDSDITDLMNLKQPELKLAFQLGQLPTPEEIQQLSDNLNQTQTQLKTLQSQAQTPSDTSQIKQLKHQASRQNEKMESFSLHIQSFIQQLAALPKRDAKQYRFAQKVYLTLAAPNLQGWAARKQAIKTNQILTRLKTLTRDNHDPTLGVLLEQLEVTLTYLELMDTSSTSSQAHLQTMIKQSQLIEQIDQHLSTPTSTTDMRTWLLEVGMTLDGEHDAK